MGEDGGGEMEWNWEQNRMLEGNSVCINGNGATEV